jgi:hypothetical protein
MEKLGRDVDSVHRAASEAMIDLSEYRDCGRMWCYGMPQDGLGLVDLGP